MTASGFYHCSVKSVGRAKGRSVVAAAAYRAGERLEDERTGETADFRARSGVEETFILTPEDAPAWAQDRERLWNEAERAEPRANGRLATELELALPCELDAEAHKRLLRDYLGPIIDKYEVAADVAIHAPGGGGDHRNQHAHVLVTHRELGPEGFGEVSNPHVATRKVKGVEKEVTYYGIAATPADVVELRQQWEQAVNREYERAGLDIRVDHRSHADRGIEQEATKHLGPTASAMERRGEDSDLGDLNRDIEQRNEARRFEAEITAIKAQIDALQPEQVFGGAASRTTEPAAPVWDRDADNMAWENRLADAAEHAEKTAQQASQGEKHRGGMGEDRPAAEGPYAPLQTPEPAIAAKTERELTGTAAEIRMAWAMSETASQLEDALAARGVSLAEVASEEAYASERRAAFAKEIGNFVTPWREGEIVAVDQRGNAWRLNERTTGDERGEIEGRLAGADRDSLMNLADTKEAMRAASWASERADRQAERERARPASSIEAAIADALTSTMTGTDFAAALDEKGLTVARVNAADAHALETMRNGDIEAGTFDGIASGRIFAHVLEGDFAAVTRQGDVFRLSPQKLDLEDIEQRLADVQTGLPSVMKAYEHIEEVRDRRSLDRTQHEAEFIAGRIEAADLHAGQQEMRQATRAAEHAVDETFAAPAAAVDTALHATGGLLGSMVKAVEAIGDFLGGLFGGPKFTQQQAHDQAQAAGNIETQHAHDFARNARASEVAYDDQAELRKKAQQEQAMSFAQRYGAPPPTQEAIRGREHDHDRERERE